MDKIEELDLKISNLENELAEIREMLAMDKKNKILKQQEKEVNQNLIQLVNEKLNLLQGSL